MFPYRWWIIGKTILQVGYNTVTLPSPSRPPASSRREEKMLQEEEEEEEEVVFALAFLIAFYENEKDILCKC